MTSTGLLHLAFDACDPTTMLDLAASGACPTIGGLLAEAVTAEVVPPAGVYAGSIWPTLSTGRRVGSHRHHCWAEVDDGYRVVNRPITAMRGERYWERLAATGHRVAVLDAPHSSTQTAPAGGAMISQWGVHDRDVAPAVWPSDLLGDVPDWPQHPLADLLPHGAVGPVAPCDHVLRAGTRRTHEEEAALTLAIMAAVEVKSARSSDLLRRGGWDLFTTTFGEAHCVGHQLWHLHDRTHRWFESCRAEVLGDPVTRVYQRLDQSVAEHLAFVGDDTPVVLLLSHGMGPRRGAEHLLDAVLHRLATGGDRSPRRATVLRAIDRLPGPSRSGLLRWRAHRRPSDVGIPLPRQQDRPWFAVPNGASVGAVRLNVRGRDASGFLDPGLVDGILTDLRAAFLELVDLDTGRPAVDLVSRAEELYERFPGDRLPDLLVTWAGTQRIEQMWSPRVGWVGGTDPTWRSGDHHDRGLLVVRSPRLSPGRRAEPIDAADVAPTLCASLGVTLPEADGVVRPDLVA